MSEIMKKFNVLNKFNDEFKTKKFKFYVFLQIMIGVQF